MINLALGYVDNEIEEYIPGAVDSVLGTPIDYAGNKATGTSDLDFSGLIRYDIPVSGCHVLTPQFDWTYNGIVYSSAANSVESADCRLYKTVGLDPFAFISIGG